MVSKLLFFACLLLFGLADAAESEARAVFNQIDLNGDGHLSFDEFVLFHEKMTKNDLMPNAFVETESIADQIRDTSRRRHAAPEKPRRGGCYRVCPQPIVYRNGEPFGGPFGPDPYYSYGQNHLY